MSWSNVREDAISYMRKKKEEPLYNYLSEMNFSDTFGYEYRDTAQKLIIYTNKPGIWIGLQGSGVDRLKELLKETWGYTPTVEFVEVRDGFISYVKENR